jgi:hypothetical protein
MKIKSLLVAIGLLVSMAVLPTAVALEKPTVESFTASKLDVDVTDPDLVIDFEVVISHPKGLENTSTLLILTNSSATTISIPLIRTDSPINFTNTKVTFKGKLTLHRSLTPGVYTYSIDGVRNNIDSGTRFPTGIVTGPVVRTLKSAESGILVRSNGFLNLDYETINGPAFGSQSGISYVNAAKYTTVTAPIWKIGEIFDPSVYFEVAVSGVELSITTSTPKICTADGKMMKLISEGECQYKVTTAKTKDFIEKSKSLSATVTAARTAQVLKVESVTPLKPASLPTSILLSPVYASGTSAVEYVMPKSITPSICEAGGYVLKIVNSGTCTVTYKTEGNSQYLPSDTYRQNIEVLKDDLPVVAPTPVVTPTPTPTPTVKPVVKKTITCTKGTKSVKRTGTNPKCPKGFKLKR